MDSSPIKALKASSSPCRVLDENNVERNRQELLERKLKLQELEISHWKKETESQLKLRMKFELDQMKHLEEINILQGKIEVLQSKLSQLESNGKRKRAPEVDDSDLGVTKRLSTGEKEVQTEVEENIVEAGLKGPTLVSKTVTDIDKIMSKLFGNEEDSERETSSGGEDSEEDTTSDGKNDAVLVENDNNNTMEWNHLRFSRQKELLQKIENLCGVHVRKNCPIFSSNWALTRLINKDNRSSNSDRPRDSDILVKMMEDYIEEIKKNTDIDLLEEELTKELANIAWKEFFPDVCSAIFETKSNSFEDVFKVLSSSKIMRSSADGYTFADPYLSLFFLGKFLGQVNLESLHTALLIMEEPMAEEGVSTGIKWAGRLWHPDNPTNCGKFAHDVVLYFLNHFMPSQPQEDWIGPFSEDVLLACLGRNYTKLINCIVKNAKITGKVLAMSVLWSDLDTVELIFNSFMSSGGDPLAVFRGGCSLFHFALMRSDFHIVEKLWNGYGFCDEMKQMYMQNIICKCVGNSLNCSEVEIMERKYILVMLLESDPSLLIGKEIWFLRNPNNYFGVHLELIQFLAERGANLTETNKTGETLAHQLNGTPKQYQDLLEYLVRSGHGDLLKAKDSKGNSPLYIAFIRRMMTEETLQLFIQCGANLNDSNLQGNNVLPCAVAGGYGLGMISKLVEAGANWKSDENEILIMAVILGKMEVLEYFVSLGANVNSKGSNGKNLLHFALTEACKWNTAVEIHLIVKTLLGLGTIVDSKDNEGKMPLYYAKVENKRRCVKPQTINLLKRKAKATKKGKEGSTQ